jgi:hypothetical protein
VSTDREVTRIVRSWLEEGVNALPDRVLDAVLDQVPATPQRRPWWPAWRLPYMNTSIRIAMAAVAVVVVALIAINLLPKTNGVGGPPSTPLPTSTVAPTSTAAPTSTSASTSSPTSDLVSTAGWLAFSSKRYGYDIKYPSYLTPTQSVRQWSLTVDQKNWLSPANDTFKGQVGFAAFSVNLPAGTARDAWIASYYRQFGIPSPDPCTHTLVDLGTKAVAGHPVVFYRESDVGATCGGTTAFVVVGNRLYVFFIGLPGWEPTLETLLSTVTFRP